jgi:tRNA nucleotidyltransferase/poly(A) polymerase
VNHISSEFKKHRLYSSFVDVKNQLKRHQFVCWVAGGAVRDLILGRAVTDFDLVTDASTEVLKQIFPNALLVGEAFGVLKIPLHDGDFFDLATFREESDYLDGRHPSKVSSSTPTRDSARRDFTINSMFWDDENQCLQDYNGGLFDLKLRKLVCVGQASVRFEEDKLRVLRLVRFAAQLGFEIDPLTQSEAVLKVPEIDCVSGERVGVEFKKIDQSGNLSKIVDGPLFRKLLAHIFLINTDQIEMVRATLSKVQQIALLLTLVKPEQDLSNLLKQRLKYSNADLKIYKNLKKISDKKINFPLEELAFELESGEDFEKAFEVYEKAGLVAEDRLKLARKLLTEVGEPLVWGKELLGRIPNHLLGTELREIRLKQLSKIFSTKDDVDQYLGKKYAI